MTNKLIATAGVLSLGITAVHVVGGGADVHDPILASTLSPLLKGFVSVVWHGVTANLFICSVMLFIASQHTKYCTLLTSLVIANHLSFTALFLFYGIVRLQSVWLMPPWIGFAAIVLVAVLGLRKHQLQN